MSQLYLLHYNNYYNRQVRREESIDDYMEYLVGGQEMNDENGNPNIVEQVNFISTDYTNTEVVVNWVGPMPNYLVEYDTDKKEIRSRWFVTGHQKQNYCQYILQLKNDLVAHYIDEVQDQPMFIEKATPTQINDPAIFNSEDMTFNQIKTGEVTLRDNTNCAWVVGFIPRDSFTSASQNNINVNISANGSYNYYVTDITEWGLWNNIYAPAVGKTTYTPISTLSRINEYLDFGFYGITSPGLGVHQILECKMNIRLYNSSGYKLSSNSVTEKVGSGTSYNGNYPTRTNGANIGAGFLSSNSSSATGWYCFDDGAIAQGLMAVTSRNATTHPNASNYNEQYFYNQILDIADISIKSTTTYNNCLNYDGKIILDKKTNRRFLMQFIRVNDNLNVDLSSSLKQQLYNNLTLNGDVDKQKNYYTVYTYNKEDVYFNGGYNNYTFTSYLTGERGYLSLTELSDTVQTQMILPGLRNHLQDAPYDMFCMPYIVGDTESIKIYTDNNEDDTSYGGYITLNKENSDVSLTAACQISAKLGKDNIYDLQLLPYCPIKGIVPVNTSNKGCIFLKSITKQLVTKTPLNGTQPDTDNIKNINVILYSETSEFTVDIPYEIPFENDIVECKIKSETEKWRLVSPNYSGMFEFNPQMNGGVRMFNVDCNYKPFSPYIHVNPDFNSYYGSDWNDSRGLVCGGDFSLPQTTSAWTEYQMQNKNYQQMFDRQIQNMEVNNSVQRYKEMISASLGVANAAISGVTSGAVMGASAGKAAGPYGAIAGAVIGGVGGGAIAGGVSAWAAQKDIEQNNILRQEGLDYTKDMFGYQLGNIQALPESIAKVSAFTANNKIFPFLEKYVADLPNSNYQTNALRNKIKFNGMTIMRVSTIAEFLQDNETYIKGRLIRIPDLFDEAYHIASALADELYQGIFISTNLSKRGNE